MDTSNTLTSPSLKEPVVGDSLKLALLAMGLSLAAQYIGCPDWLERSIGCFVIAMLFGLLLAPVTAIMAIRFLPRDLFSRTRWWQGVLSLLLIAATLYQRCGRPTELP